jgi:hypothetical protein
VKPEAGREQRWERERRAALAALERTRRDAERVLDYLRELEAPSSADEIREGLAGRGRRFSSWSLRGLLRYLVAGRAVREVRGARPGRRTVLFEIGETR